GPGVGERPRRRIARHAGRFARIPADRVAVVAALAVVRIDQAIATPRRARAEGSAPEALAAHDASEKRAVGRQPRAEPDATIRIARAQVGADAPALAPRAQGAGRGGAAGPADRDGRIAEHDARVPEQAGTRVHDETAGARTGRGAPAEHEEHEGGE